MPSGLIVYNDGGNLQIDSTFQNLCYVTKGSVATGTVVDQFSVGTITLNGLSAYPMVVVSAPGGAWATVTSYSSGTATVDIVAHGPVNTNVNYWVFAPPTSSGSNYGLQVFNAAGTLVFDSTFRYMKVVGSLSDLAGPSTPTASLTLPAGRTYAVWQTSPMAYARNVNQGIPGFADWYLYSMRGCFKVNANVVASMSDEFAITHYGNTSPPSYNQSATCFVVDVTGY